MRPEALDEELSGIESYSNLLRRWRRLSEDEVEIVTLENKVLHAEITDEGWITEDGQCYATLEGLLKTASPKFEELWNEELYEKLVDLKREQEKQKKLGNQ